jgi:fatty acid amide hydrolase
MNLTHWSATELLSLLESKRDEEAARPQPVSPVEEAAAAADRGSVGLPVGVQVAGRHWDETGVLEVMELLESRYRVTPAHPTAGPGGPP